VNRWQRVAVVMLILWLSLCAIVIAYAADGLFQISLTWHFANSADALRASVDPSYDITEQQAAHNYIVCWAAIKSWTIAAAALPVAAWGVVRTVQWIRQGFKTTGAEDRPKSDL
jgi:hypothetical protein